MSKGKIKGAKQRVIQFASKEDGTYDAETGEPVPDYPDGFQVSFVRPEAFDKLTDDQWDELSNHLADKYGSKEHVGVYGGVAETSFHITNLEDAKELMYTFNQESILNWSKKHLIGTDEEHKALFRNSDFNFDVEVDYERVMREIRSNS